MESAEGTRLLLRFRAPVLLLIATVAYGVLGYSLLEGWSLFDALYMTITTLTTVGFAEVRPLTSTGRAFTLTLILSGVVSLFVLVGIVAQLVATGELGEPLRRRRMRRRLSDLQAHIVVCGYGRVGRATVRDLLKEDVPVAVVDESREIIRELDRLDVPHMIGDATDEAVLTDVGIERARGLISAVGIDAVNVYITLTARAMNPRLFIVSRTSEPSSTERLHRAGADRVVSPYSLSGGRMAFLALRPSVVDFMDTVTLAPDLRLEEVQVRDGSTLAGKTIREAVDAHDGTAIVALKKSGRPLAINPDAHTRLEVGDLLVALGPVDALEAMAGRG